jgi:hypothetical protein
MGVDAPDRYPIDFPISPICDRLRSACPECSSGGVLRCRCVSVDRPYRLSSTSSSSSLLPPLRYRDLSMPMGRAEGKGMKDEGEGNPDRKGREEESLPYVTRCNTHAV